MKSQILRPLLPSEARRLGVSWPYAVGIKANRNAGREFILTNRIRPSSGIDSIHITRRFNLGNHIRQVANAVRFAEVHGIPTVRLPSGSQFSPGRVGSVELTTADAEAGSAGRFITGDFFYYEKVGITYGELERGRIIKNLRPHFPLLSHQKISTKLGIHLRSGDTFSSNPHPLYMPPPLQFFLDSIERSHGSQSNGVHVICQDLQHPYLNRIVDFCVKREIECEVSSSSLDEDFKSLASFEELCLSQGTLALAAAWLSGGCKRIFAFQRDGSEMLTTAQMGIRVESATSASPLGPWRGTESQMALLSDPSATSVRWESYRGESQDG